MTLNQVLTWCRLRTSYMTRTTSSIQQFRSFKRERKRHNVYNDENFEKITVPQTMLENLKKKNVRKAQETADRRRQKYSQVLISATRENYNFFKGQSYKVFDPKQLASHGWKHRNCPPDHFTLVNHAGNPAIETQSEDYFRDMRLDDRIVQYLEDQDIVHPSNIQKLAIPAMLSGRHVVCAAETGSGKTYAYLLPMIHNMCIEMESQGEHPANNSPHTIIMVPSRELADQVMAVCERLSEYIPFTAYKLCGHTGAHKDIQTPEGVYMDVLIATPGMLGRMFRYKLKSMSLARLSSVVLDEADTLLDDSFNSLVNGILKTFQLGVSSPSGEGAIKDGIQVALVSATYPRGLDTTVGHVLPIDAFTILKTKHLHHLMPHIPQKFIKMKSRDKTENILRVLQKKKNQRYIIFCNKSETCFWLSKTLKEYNIDNVCMTGKMDEDIRSEILTSYLEGEHNILVCTDVASRGLDTYSVEHVVNFDFPRYISDYIHRAGRVGRVGGKHSEQYITSFVAHPWNVDLVWKIEMAARQQSELHNVNANIKRNMNVVIDRKYGEQKLRERRMEEKEKLKK